MLRLRWIALSAEPQREPRTGSEHPSAHRMPREVRAVSPGAFSRVGDHGYENGFRANFVDPGLDAARPGPLTGDNACSRVEAKADLAGVHVDDGPEDHGLGHYFADTVDGARDELR